MTKFVPYINLIIVTLLSLSLWACSEQAQPYEESNRSIPITQEKGSIKTH